MFLGEYQHTIDLKGRLIIPARFREDLGNTFIITKGLDGCLFVYPFSEWSALEQKMRSLPFTKADARAFVRFFFAGAAECELDKQGRVLIPTPLREYADLGKEVVVAGIAHRVEIWSKNRWLDYTKQTSSIVEEISEKIVDYDLNI